MSALSGGGGFCAPYNIQVMPAPRCGRGCAVLHGGSLHPILFKYGFIEIRFYGLMYVVAILVGSYIIKREVRRKEIPMSPDQVMNFIVWVVLGGVVGARLYYVLFNLSFYLANF